MCLEYRTSESILSLLYSFWWPLQPTIRAAIECAEKGCCWDVNVNVNQDP